MIFIFLSALLAAPFAALAEDLVVQEKPGVSMEALVAEALRNNPDLLEAEAEIAVARGERRATGQWKNPEVSVEYGEKRNSDRSTGGLMGKGNTQSYRISQTFEFPGKADLRKAVGDRNIHLAELSLEQLRLEIAARARSLAVQWIIANHEVMAVREVEDRHATLIKVLKQRAPAGVQSVLDRLIIEADHIRISALSHQIEEKKGATQIALNLLCGKSPGAPIRVSVSLELPPLNVSWERLFEKAKTSSLFLKIREIEIARATRQLSHARLGAAPDITIGPFFSQEKAGDRERILGVGISLPLPLWDSNRGQTDLARANLNRAEAGRSQALREIERELAQQHEAYHHILELLQKTPLRSLAELQNSADFADRHYRLGAVTVQAYLEMQDQYLEATSALLDTAREGQEHYLKIQLLTSDSALAGEAIKKERP